MFHHGTFCATFNRLCLNISRTSVSYTQVSLSCNIFARKRFLSHAKKNDMVITQSSNKESFCNFFTVPGFSSKKKEYVGKKVVGFTMDQMYQVVSDVENYYNFVPFCTKSIVHSRKKDELLGELEIGFPPIFECYTSLVTLKEPHLVKAVCSDGRLFDHLVTIWKFSPGLKNHPHSCLIDFYVSFEFKSLIHSKLANMFFNELVRQMECAFFREAKKRYGRPTIREIKLQTT